MDKKGTNRNKKNVRPRSMDPLGRESASVPLPKKKRTSSDEPKNNNNTTTMDVTPLVVPDDAAQSKENKSPAPMIPVSVGFGYAQSQHKVTNHQKCLALGSRNMSSKDRHLLQDLRGLIPHARDHAKLTTGDHLGENITELCDLHHCNSLLFMESHRHDISYLWMSQSPIGPSIKFLLSNIHTADEMRMTGNCLKFSRPLLHFDKEFSTISHLRVAKSLLQMAFNTPRYHPKSKPFVDHIISFFFLDGHIWFRHYQIVESSNNTPLALMEIGPRFTMQPVVILNGTCRGNVLWKNPDAPAPTEIRRSRKMRQLMKVMENERVQIKSDAHRRVNPDPQVDPLDLIFK